MESLRNKPFGKQIDSHWSETRSEPCKTSKMECFTKTGKGFQLITMLAKHPMLHPRFPTRLSRSPDSSFNQQPNTCSESANFVLVSLMLVLSWYYPRKLMIFCQDLAIISDKQLSDLSRLDQTKLGQSSSKVLLSEKKKQPLLTTGHGILDKTIDIQTLLKENDLRILGKTIRRFCRVQNFQTFIFFPEDL